MDRRIGRTSYGLTAIGRGFMNGNKTGKAKLPVVIGRISSSLLKKTPWNFDHAPIVQKAQEAVSAKDADTYLVQTDDLPTLKDNTHFDTAGQTTLGERMATEMLKALEPAKIQK